MPLLNKRSYTKRTPWRDATLFILICEGSTTEPNYFEFFHQLTEKIKVIAVPSEQDRSAPKHLIDSAFDKSEEFDDGGDYELWFVIDVDRWRDQINLLQKEAKQQGWLVAISNPCFEVWLNNHFQDANPPANDADRCRTWKAHVHETYGGFDHTQHPTFISRAIEKSKATLVENGYMPEIGSTQVFRLAEKIYELTKSVLVKYFI